MCLWTLILENKSCHVDTNGSVLHLSTKFRFLSSYRNVKRQAQDIDIDVLTHSMEMFLPKANITLFYTGQRGNVMLDILL